MPRNQSDDPQYIEEVPGVTVPWEWSGRNSSNNRRRVPPNQFIQIDNVRIDDGEIIGRKGLAKVNSGDSSDTSCVIGTDIVPSVATAGRFFITLGYDPGNLELYLYDPKFDDTQVVDIDPDGKAGEHEYLIKYQGNLLGDAGGALTLRESGGVMRSTVGEQLVFPQPRHPSANIGIHTSSGSQPVVGPTLETDEQVLEQRGFPAKNLEDLYFVSNDQTSTGLPYRWDGNTSHPLGVASDFGGNELQHVGMLFEQLFVVASPADEGSPVIYVREFDGTWTSYNCPTLTQEEQFTCQGITYYKDKALLHGWQESSGGGGNTYGTILVWDGSSVTLGTETAVTGASEDAIRGIFDATIFNGLYRYAYRTTSGNLSYLGSYNGTTFNDTATNVSSAIGTGGYGPVGLGARGPLLVITAYDYNNDFDTKVFTTTNLSTFTEITVENESTISIGVPHKVFTL